MASLSSNLRQIRITRERALLSNEVPETPGATQAQTAKSVVAYPSMIASKTQDSQDDLEFTFPFPPQTISYRDLTPEMSQIQRPGRSPIVAFSKYRARQVDIQFLVAVPNDGLQIDVETDLRTLQAMANTQRPVWFYNYDRFLTNAFSEALGGTTNFFWTITDINFESVRRNSAQRIVQAQVSMSLVETNNPKIVVAQLPKITYGENPPQRSNSGQRNNNQSNEQQYTEWTQVWERQNTQATGGRGTGGGYSGARVM